MSLSNREQLIKDWQYKKDHFFVVGHDDVTIKSFCSFLKEIVFLIIFGVIACILFYTVFLWVLTKDFAGSLKIGSIFTLITGMVSGYYQYILFINYVENENMTGSVIISLLVCGLLYYFSWYIAIFGAVLLVLIYARLTKHALWDTCNNLDDYLKTHDNNNETD